MEDARSKTEKNKEQKGRATGRNDRGREIFNVSIVKGAAPDQKTAGNKAWQGCREQCLKNQKGLAYERPIAASNYLRKKGKKRTGLNNSQTRGRRISPADPHPENRQNKRI